MSTKKAKQQKVKKPLKVECRHAGSVIETDKQGHIWTDTMTMCMELMVSPFTWSGLLLPQVEKFYGGDRNLFRRVRGRQALWDFTAIHSWYAQRKPPRAGYEARYLPKLREKGELAA
jgi:hypothetical protein